MTKEKFEEIKKNHNIVDCEVEDVLSFVSDLFYFEAKSLEINEPYATKTIERYKVIAQEVFCMNNEIEEFTPEN